MIGPTWKLSPEDVTRTTAILALRRVGKTYTASVIAEEMFDAGVPWVALDPTGAWWGLRSTATGKGSGLPVVILGGAHGDVPLEETSGNFVAELVLDEPGWYVIDFSLFESLAAERRFATDFATRLYRRKLRAEVKTAMHLFVDEADRFVPQRPPKGEEKMLGAFESLVRRGGVTGIGTTLISQRAAVVNKNVLEQIDQLLMLRTTGPNDRNAVDQYLKSTATPEQRAEWMRTIAALPTGVAWRWEPHGDVFEQVKIRERRTFNSSATPKAGVVQVVPSVFAKIDLDAVKEKMAATIERAKADDPVALRKEIAQLKRDLAKKPTAERVVETVEIQRLPKGLETDLRSAVGRALVRFDWSLAEAEINAAIAAVLGEDHPEPARTTVTSTAPKPRASAAPSRPDPRDTVPPVDLDRPLGKRERLILGVLAQYPEGRTQKQLAMLCGYSAKASTIDAGLSTLRKHGFVEGHRITDAGLAFLGDSVEPLPTGPALLDYWRGQLGGPDSRERKILEVLYAAYPGSVAHNDMADQTGYTRTASTVAAGMSKLRRLGLVVGWRLSDEFADAIQ